MDLRDTADVIYAFVCVRCRRERPDVDLTKAMKEAIWFSILGELERSQRPGY